MVDAMSLVSDILSGLAVAVSSGVAFRQWRRDRKQDALALRTAALEEENHKKAWVMGNPYVRVRLFRKDGMHWWSLENRGKERVLLAYLDVMDVGDRDIEEVKNEIAERWIDTFEQVNRSEYFDIRLLPRALEAEEARVIPAHINESKAPFVTMVSMRAWDKGEWVARGAVQVVSLEPAP